jgi:hypothetical protein
VLLCASQGCGFVFIRYGSVSGFQKENAAVHFFNCCASASSWCRSGSSSDFPSSLSIQIRIRIRNGIRILPQILKLFDFFSQQISASLNCVIFLVTVIGAIIFNILESILKFSRKKYSLALNLVETDTSADPDLPK